MTNPIKIVKRNLGTSYRLIIEFGIEELVKDTEYRVDLFDHMFDIIDEVKYAHTPDSDLLLEIPQHKLTKE